MANRVPACPHCGSKKVKTVDSFFRCDDCNQDFGRSTTSDDGTPLVEAIRGLRFRYGDIVKGSVRLRIAADETACLFEVYDANEGGVDKVADVLPMEEWNDLKKKLIEKMYVADWDKSYIPVNDGQSVPDNNEWELDLDITEDEVITIKGYDAQPVYYKDLMKAITPFFDKLSQE